MPRTFIKRFQTIDRLIQRKQTGTAQQLANKLEVSERTAKEFIAIMKEFGAPIYFDRAGNSYRYKDNGSFNISFIIMQ
jgi:predicted DNA-binding transcriptional regulator YafY